jgi:hypothetical protein
VGHLGEGVSQGRWGWAAGGGDVGRSTGGVFCRSVGDKEGGGLSRGARVARWWVGVAAGGGRKEESVGGWDIGWGEGMSWGRWGW